MRRLVFRRTLVSSAQARGDERHASGWRNLYAKLWSVFQEGYDLGRLRSDLIAGLTVAIVALPLSMAIAIASGVTPAMGLYTAVAGGFLRLGSIRQPAPDRRAGPAPSSLLVSATAARNGVDGLILATALSGLMLIAAGWLRLGGFVKYFPYPRHRRLHRRHRGHHIRKPAQKPVWPDIIGTGARRGARQS